LGALLAWAVARFRPKLADDFTVPVASGLIAGESLVGVGIILAVELLSAAGWM